MATKTTNYNLTKPSYNESADISVINQNMDIIDEKMKEIENASGGGTVDAYTKKQTDDLLLNKVDKVDGKGLSTNDFEDSFKNKLNGIEEGANKTVVDSALSSGSTNPVQNKVVTATVNNKVDNGIISDEWNSATTYEVGQYCIYNNSLWKCILQHNGQTPEEGTYWTKVSVGSEFNTLNSNLTTKTSLIGRTVNIPTTPTIASNGNDIVTLDIDEITSGEYIDVLPCINTNSGQLLGIPQIYQNKLVISLYNISSTKYNSQSNKSMYVFFVKK